MKFQGTSFQHLQQMKLNSRTLREASFQGFYYMLIFPYSPKVFLPSKSFKSWEWTLRMWGLKYEGEDEHCDISILEPAWKDREVPAPHQEIGKTSTRVSSIQEPDIFQKYRVTEVTTISTWRRLSSNSWSKKHDTITRNNCKLFKSFKTATGWKYTFKTT